MTTDNEARVKVGHLRQILLWPVYLVPPADDDRSPAYWEQLVQGGPGSPWHEVDDEFGDPEQFRERHYNEFVSFLPPVQRFLYGEALGASRRHGFGESPITVMRRDDVRAVRVWLENGDQPVTLRIAHVDLYFFLDIDIAILALEVFVDDLPLDVAEAVLFRFGRAYPAYWQDDGAAGHCPWRVEWLSASGDVLAASDYEDKAKFLRFVGAHRATCVADHWAWLLSPMVLDHGGKSGVLRYRQLEYYRMPYMAFLAFDNDVRLNRNDYIRLAMGVDAGVGEQLPYSRQYLQDFEQAFCYDRYDDPEAEVAAGGVRFLGSGHTLVVVGKSSSEFFMSPNGGYLGRFRHQHFLLFLIAHFQKAGLRMFADQLVAMASRLNTKDLESSRRFRRDTRAALEQFMRFAQRSWFHEVSNQAQMRDLFAMTRRHLQLEPLYDDVREELQDMGNFLDVEAMRRQNETVVRLTVVTILGLMGTMTTGLLGMNLLAWEDKPVAWRVTAFLAVFLPMVLLTLYTVVKSRRLSEFLDVMSDDEAGFIDRLRSFRRLWFR
jgi:CorA-like Mg2+ transporter protein